MKLTDDNILQANINRTKQYVRDYGGKVLALPTATSSNVGQIYQYTGATTLTYTHGYFYECKENNGTYSWENVPVGEGSGDVSDSTTTITTSTTTYPEFSAGETLKVIFGKIKKFLSDLHDKKADKATNATSGNLAGLDSNGNLTDSGSKASDFAASSQAVPSGGTTGQVLAKASGTDYDTEWVNASGGSGGHTILNSSGTAMTHRDNLQFVGASVTDDSTNGKTVVSISGKADKVTSATNGHLAGLDSNGNLTDSGKQTSDFVGTSDVKTSYQSSPSTGQVYDAAYVNGLAGYEAFEVRTSSSSTAGKVQTAWSSGTTSIAGKSCYSKTLTLTNPVYGIPKIMLKPSSGTPTATEEEQFNCLDYYGVDSASPNSLKLYAVTKPTSNFSIYIERTGGRV